MEKFSLKNAERNFYKAINLLSFAQLKAAALEPWLFPVSLIVNNPALLALTSWTPHAPKDMVSACARTWWQPKRSLVWGIQSRSSDGHKTGLFLTKPVFSNKREGLWANGNFIEFSGCYEFSWCYNQKQQDSLWKAKSGMADEIRSNQPGIEKGLIY